MKTSNSGYDPDEGLEIHPEFLKKLKAQKRSIKNRIPMEGR
jgi:hypothetical protein